MGKHRAFLVLEIPYSQDVPDVRSRAGRPIVNRGRLSRDAQGAAEPAHPGR